MPVKSLRLLLAAFVLSLLGQAPASAGVIKHVIVIAMENTDASQIYGNVVDAPYINNVLKPLAARATNFTDTLPHSVLSEPHYIVMEAGTRSFADHIFNTNDPPSAVNSTASHAHLVRQMNVTPLAARVTWMSYQQGMNATTGACPIVNSYPYASRHNPFIFFRDISGSPPSKTTAGCAAHHRPYSSFAADLTANRLAKYNYIFITPDLCHDMHDKCTSPSRIRAGDDWLRTELPRMITWANANSGVVLVVWDEGSATAKMPFFAVGKGVRKNFVTKLLLTHNSIIKSVETIFGLPILPAVTASNTLQSLFVAGAYP